MIKQKVQSFYDLSSRRKGLLLVTLGLSLYSFLLMRFFKEHASFGQKNTGKSQKTDKFSIASDIRFVIRVVGQYVPFENVCRHHAYQAKLLCNFYGIPYQIFIGFRKNKNGKIEGHAWTVVQDEIITGFCDPTQYIIQAVYS